MVREVAAGGMGVVFAGRQPRLERPVAIKILRPEHATAVAAEGFLDEGRLLARLAHPNIIPIYDAGESDGLLYYVMEFVEGETLADRLTRGPLPPAEAIRRVRDLLAGLSAAHAQGVVHRDVKPANIFLRGSQTLLGDFGIARWRRDSEPGLTQSGQYIGTPSYMAPEQREGVAATPRSDVYSTGMVIYEACTGRRWPAYQPPERADWSGVPSALEAPMRRALALDPAERWPDARDFAEAAAGAERRRRGPVLGAIAAAALGGLLIWRLWPAGSPPEPRRGFPLQIASFETIGATAAAEAGIGDSVAAYLRQLLSGVPDFDVLEPGPATRTVPAVSLSGTATVAGGNLDVVVRETNPAGRSGEPVGFIDRGTVGAWHELAEKLGGNLVYQIWKRAESDPFFPDRAIPRDPSARSGLAKAEQLFAQGRWDEARFAYRALDTTCLLCALRSIDIGRWFGLPRDSARLALLQRTQDSFPDHYRSLIRAVLAGFPARLDTLEQASQVYSGFYLLPFEYFDELFHRGPLVGRLRADALGPLQTALLDRPNFEPAREHLAWLLMSEGDSASARRALDSLLRRPALSNFSAALPVLRKLGYHWRYLSADSARRFSNRLLRDPSIIGYPDASAGARLLMTMDAPRGAVELGGMFADWRGRPDAALPGLLAQLFGYAALGRPDSMRVVGRRFSRLSGAAASYGLLALELEAVLRTFDPDSEVAGANDVREELTRAAARLAAEPELHRRAAWALGLLAARRGDGAGVSMAQRSLRDEPSPGSLGRILEATVVGRGNAGRALTLLPVIPTLDQEAEYADPLEDAVLHLLRAEWQQRAGSPAEARRTLRWHEHSQISGHLTGEPQAGEMAWALGSLARWKRRELLMGMAVEDSEWCGVNRAIQRLWADAEPVFRARAAVAGLVATTPACTAAP